MDFGSQVGAKLGGKIEPRQAKTGQDKGRQGKRREGKGKEEEGKGLEGKGVERGGGGDSALGGEGFARPLGGDRSHVQSESSIMSMSMMSLKPSQDTQLCLSDIWCDPTQVTQTKNNSNNCEYRGRAS